MRSVAASVVLVLILPAAAAAQAGSSQPGPELFGWLAVAWLTEDEGSLGSGVDVGAGGRYRWPGPLAAEVQLSRLHTEREFDSGVEFDATLVQLSGRLLHHFSAGNSEPYLGGGVGLTRFERTSVFPIVISGPNGRPMHQGDERFRCTGTEITWGGVAGVRVRAPRGVQLRPEVAVQITAPSNFIVVSAGMKIGWAP